MLYVDSSAWVKRYVDEPRAQPVRDCLIADADWVTANHTWTEVFRVLHLVSATPDVAVDAFTEDWHRTAVVAIDHELCLRAGRLAVDSNTRTLDALHLAAAERAGGADLTILTCDVRMAIAARSLGFPVLGN